MSQVQILEAGAHSGKASGIIPSSFRILRQILDRYSPLHTHNREVSLPFILSLSLSPQFLTNRIEDSRNGDLPPELSVEIPPNRIEEAKSMIQPTVLSFPFVFVSLFALLQICRMCC